VQVRFCWWCFGRDCTLVINFIAIKWPNRTLFLQNCAEKRTFTQEKNDYTPTNPCSCVRSSYPTSEPPGKENGYSSVVGSSAGGTESGASDLESESPDGEYW